MSLFCRHNRFVADCPICSKGTVLESGSSSSRRSSSGGTRKPAKAKPAPAAHGPSVSSPAYEDADGVAYVVRLERVPGGVRLAEWQGSTLRRRAPVLGAADLVRLAEAAGQVLADGDAAALSAATASEQAEGPAQGPGVSKGRAGDFKEELRVEALEDGRVRVGRWVLRPNQGWQLQEAPPMLPAKRYAEAVAAAVRKGLLPQASEAAVD
ncbi:MAG TPA: hypothetical protein VFY44_05890 [Thermoleophilaceae bacterium]|nr:hypothetical protein [Thermoleophilaceae bacterium]